MTFRAHLRISTNASPFSLTLRRQRRPLASQWQRRGRRAAEHELHQGGVPRTDEVEVERAEFGENVDGRRRAGRGTNLRVDAQGVVVARREDVRNAGQPPASDGRMPVQSRCDLTPGGTPQQLGEFVDVAGQVGQSRQRSGRLGDLGPHGCGNAGCPERGLESAQRCGERVGRSRHVARAAWQGCWVPARRVATPLREDAGSKSPASNGDGPAPLSPVAPTVREMPRTDRLGATKPPERSEPELKLIAGAALLRARIN